MTSITARNAAALTERNGSTIPEAPAPAPTPKVGKAGKAAKAAAPAPKAAKATAPTQAPCGCGCAAPAKPGRTYLPGHDARHAGQVGRWLAANPKATPAAQAAEVAKLPTPALQAKARKFAANRAAEATRKTAAAELRARYQAELKSKLAELGA